MKLTKSFNIVTSAILAMVASTAAHADIYSSLTPDQQAAINNGQQVSADPQDVDGSAWPRVTIYQRAEATPDQVAAVMFDYNLHKTMFAPKKDANGKVTSAGITESTADRTGAANTNILYSMVFPSVLGISLPEEHYTVNDVIAASASGYQITWTFVKATSMKDTSGSVQFERLGTGTLIAYTNFISPPRPALAKLITKMYVQQVKDTVTSLVAQVASERNGNQAQLNAQLSLLSKALGR